MISEIGSSSGQGTGYPLQYSWVSFVAQLVKNPPAMQETCVRSLDWEDALEMEMATRCSIPACIIPQTEELDGPQSTRSQSWT